MSILPPYNFTQLGDKYTFRTDNSIVYSVEFTDGTFYFLDLPNHISVFELSIRVLNPIDSIGQPFDKRVEVTIVDILSTFFNNNKNSLIYVCDTIDNRQQGRFRKFDMWFKKNQTASLEKYDVNFTTLDMQILASLIVHSENPDKELLVTLFLDLYK
jgi:hypothetical protein